MTVMKILCESEDEVIIKVRPLHETPKAILIKNVDEDEVWLPLSVVEVLDDVEGEYEIAIPMWLVEEKDII